MPPHLTIDELAGTTGASTRTIRSFQSLGLLDPPALRGRTGLYSEAHAERISAILRLQDQGFSLQSLTVLFAANERGMSLNQVLGLPAASTSIDQGPESDMAELYGFADLMFRRPGRPLRGRPVLSVVPTTVWGETAAS